MNSSIPVYSISIPEYNLDSQPDYAAIGTRLDRFIEKHFPGQRLALRGIYLNDHPCLSRSELVATLYGWGARNCELHVHQCRGAWKEPRGVSMPTFLPESA